MDKRAFKNPYPEYYDLTPTDTQELFDEEGTLTAEFAGRLNSKINELLSHMEDGLKLAEPKDCSGYTGWAGIALLYLHLSDVYGEPSFLQKALDYVSRSLQSVTWRCATFLCGDAGPLAVAVVVYHRLQRRQEADDCLNRLLHYQRSVVRGEGSLSEELLYGRIGYLFSLVFINQQLQEEKIPMLYIQQICDAILASGENLSRKSKSQDNTPLLHEWCNEYCVGAAHGLAGIYYFLMQPGFVVGDDRLLRVVKPSLDYMFKLNFPSFIYRVRVEESPDHVVQWCQGPPGLVYMLLQAHKVYGERDYLMKALQFTGVVWDWGLLKKGYGLCHGVAGNAYAFLAFYKHTHNLEHLYKACRFAEWCLDYGKHGCRTPDTPFSLFKGLAGTIYFLADLLQPLRSKFPGFEM